MQRKWLFVSIHHSLLQQLIWEIAAILHHCSNLRPNLLGGVGTVTEKKNKENRHALLLLAARCLYTVARHSTTRRWETGLPQCMATSSVSPAKSMQGRLRKLNS